MDKEILNMEEAAEFFNVSVKTFIKLLKEEKIPARKIGREWRFSRKALVDWLSSGDSQAYTSSESETREFFNKIAPQWEDIRSGYYDESIKNKLLDLKIIGKDMTVVDLGAGNGYISRTAALQAKKVIAVDISTVMLRELEKRAKVEGLKNIVTIEGNGCELPLESGSIDVVCSSMYLHHIDEPELAIKEMRRVLKASGKVFLADLKEHANTELKEKMHDIWTGFSMEDMKLWFAKCGFGSLVFDNLGDIFILTAEAQ